MMKRNAVLWLRISCWAGAVIDVLAGLSMLFPALFAFSNRLTGFAPGVYIFVRKPYGID
jgi:hypothetical protein